jgi:hypothetical protein
MSIIYNDVRAKERLPPPIAFIPTYAHAFTKKLTNLPNESERQAAALARPGPKNSTCGSSFVRV